MLYYGDLDALVHATDQRAADRFTDAREKLAACIGNGPASGPEDALTRLLFEYWPRCLRDPKAAALDRR